MFIRTVHHTDTSYDSTLLSVGGGLTLRRGWSTFGCLPDYSRGGDKLSPLIQNGAVLRRSYLSVKKSKHVCGLWLRGVSLGRSVGTFGAD